MSQSRRCPQCAAELPADAPQGLCPRCLMQAGLESRPPGAATASASPQGFTPPTPAELARLLPQLEILEFLGKGGMGAVYKARQPGLDRLVAVKILPPEVGADPAFAERFGREARALARLSHPHIVTVYDFGQADSLYYFVMEYVDGVNIRQALRAGDLSPAAALKIVPQICDALQFAHDEGIVHRDIKPENILLDRKGRIKIADFGLAKLMGLEPGSVTLTATQQTMGTFHYMAPEQLEGSHAVDHRADIYSLGVTFYEMLTGELPIGRFAPPSHKVEIDVRLDEVVLRALEKEPGRRFQHVSDVKTEVESIARASVPVARPVVVDFEKTILETLPSGKVVAVRKYRELKGCSLSEALQAVDAIIRKHGVVVPPPSLGMKLLGLGILAALAVLTILSVVYLDISPLLTTPIIFLCLLVPQAVTAIRQWGTPIGKRAAWLTGIWAFLLFGGPVIHFLTQPEATLEWLSNATGTQVGKHDADFIRGLFLVLIALALYQLIRYWVQLRREARADAPTKPTSVPSPFDPENLQRGVKWLLWLTLIVTGAIALFVTFEGAEEADGVRMAINVGAFEPWLTFERFEPKTGSFESKRHISWRHFSFWAAVTALLAWYGLHRLRDKEWTWSGWWLARPVLVRRGIKLALTAICVLGALWALTFEARATGATSKIGASKEVVVGTFDPWYIYRESPGGFSTSFRILSLSALFAYAAIYSLTLLIAAERVERRSPGKKAEELSPPAESVS